MKKTIFGIVFFQLSIFGFSQQANFSADTVCFGEHTTFTGQSSLPETQISGWYWDFDNDSNFDDAFGKYITYVFDTAMTLQVGVKVIDTAGTEYMEYNEVIVYPVPVVNFLVDNLCEDKEAVFTDFSTISSGIILQYWWDSVFSDRGCSAFTTKTTEVFPQPVAGFTFTSACIGSNVQITNSTTIDSGNISIYSWNFGDGEEAITSQPVHAFSDTGYFTIQLIVISDHYCRDTVNSIIYVYPEPNSFITTDDDAFIYANESVTLTLNGDFTTCSWSTGSTSQSVQVSQAGNYSCEITDSHGCKDTASIHIYKLNIQNIKAISDVLTPNGDGINDYLEFQNIEAYDNVQIWIYNVWGVEVYNSANYQNKWDAIYEGEYLDPGAYYFIIKVQDTEIKGNINLLR
ncbi:MAG: gliding motility-associated C-terminal domain-containing protein [Bacteroidia bacterium]|nr:gliding motility-associated C-terminal domain-containing protein [Bacteroidia bacterium]